MTLNVEVEIISIGNELLIGKVMNSNSLFLAKRVTKLGARITRITVVSDNIQEISSVIRESLHRKPRLIITTGGLGPTFDDMTLAGMAEALGCKLEVNPKALNMVKEKYETYAQGKDSPAIELSQPRIKMATIPEKTEPIRNPIGTAPAVKAKVGETLVFSLPGVPREMEAIFEEALVPLLRRASKGSAFIGKSIFVDDIMESTLAPLIDSVMLENPGVYIKSHPKGAENKPSIEIHFSITTSSRQTSQKKVRKAIDQLSQLVTGNKGNVYFLKKVKT